MLVVGLLMGLLAATTVAIGTAPPGPGLDPDAESYLGAAQAVVRGDGLRVPTSGWADADSTEPLTHFPPGFPLAVAAPVTLGASPVQAARWIIVVSALVTWTTLVVLVGRVAGARAGVGVGVAALATPAIATVHLSILSEPSFLTALVLTLTGMVALTRAAPVAPALAGDAGRAAQLDGTSLGTPAEATATGAPRIAAADEARRGGHVRKPGWSGVALRTTAALGDGGRGSAVGGMRRVALVAAGTGVAAAAAVSLRYAGFSIVAAAALWVAFDRRLARRSTQTLALALALILAPTLCTVGPWLVRATRLAGPRGVRALAAYGQLGNTLREGVQTLASWVVPVGDGWWRVAVLAVVLAGVAAMGASAWRRVRRTEVALGPAVPAVVSAHRSATVLRVVAVTAACYLDFVLISRQFADPNIPFDERILAPLLLLAEIAIALVIATWWRGRRRWSRLTVTGALAVWLALSAGTTISRIAFAREDGDDFASSDWRESPTIAWVRSPSGGADRTLYSNWPAALYFHAHRAARDLPDRLDAATIARFRDRLSRTGGVVVAFTTPSPDVASPDSLARRAGLRPVARFADGTVWDTPP